MELMTNLFHALVAELDGSQLHSIHYLPAKSPFVRFLMGFVFPFLWYYAMFLYFGNYYSKEPRERAGLSASAITSPLGSSYVLKTFCVM
ncbi:unnamed protein product [Eruca vesicaria subsp. sativa]|uniref:Uncharacterized protein n=1 Tax=Eruca vesicaria subsp. sativa TaxID=29727 RepID=A0ABC8IRD6_ERUVS|nr:unnamed protein product [Eruca vesicaria subsp. sativa]